jgi:hypothetical protein
MTTAAWNRRHTNGASTLAASAAATAASAAAAAGAGVVGGGGVAGKNPEVMPMGLSDKKGHAKGDGDIPGGHAENMDAVHLVLWHLAQHVAYVYHLACPLLLRRVP